MPEDPSVGDVFRAAASEIESDKKKVEITPPKPRGRPRKVAVKPLEPEVPDLDKPKMERDLLKLARKQNAFTLKLFTSLGVTPEQIFIVPPQTHEKESNIRPEFQPYFVDESAVEEMAQDLAESGESAKLAALQNSKPAKILRGIATVGDFAIPTVRAVALWLKARKTSKVQEESSDQPNPNQRQ